MSTLHYGILAVAAIPFVYYFLAMWCAVRFFVQARKDISPTNEFTPPVSCLKPIKGLDIEAYENYASFCRQDYPDYEILFCVDSDDPAFPLVEKLVREFPERKIRLLTGSGREAINDKVARLVRLTAEAKHDIFVITDGDVRVGPEYLRTVISPLRNTKVGAVTCLYASTKENNLVEELQSVGMISDFFASTMVAWKLDGIKFTFGQTIVTRRECVQGYGGYAVIENRPADDVYAGRLVAEQGYEVKLLSYVVQSVADFHSFKDLLLKRIRWMTVQRLMRPWGHVGLIFTFGLPWALLAVATHPTLLTALGYLGGYAFCRVTITYLVGIWGMKQRGVWKKIPLIPVWDAIAFSLWVASFARNTIRWRGVDYLIRGGMLEPAVPVHPPSPIKIN